MEQKELISPDEFYESFKKYPLTIGEDITYLTNEAIGILMNYTKYLLKVYELPKGMLVLLMCMFLDEVNGCVHLDMFYKKRIMNLFSIQLESIKKYIKKLVKSSIIFPLSAEQKTLYTSRATYAINPNINIDTDINNVKNIHITHNIKEGTFKVETEKYMEYEKRKPEEREYIAVECDEIIIEPLN